MCLTFPLLHTGLLSIFLHSLIQPAAARRKKSNQSPCQTACTDTTVYSELPITPWEVVAFAECPCLSGAICWLMLITQMRSRMTTTRSSRTPRRPQREGSVSRALSDEETGSRGGGEEMDTTVPTQHRATLKKNSHTSPPMVPRPRASNCRRRGASHR